MTSPKWMLNAAVLVAPLGVVALSLPPGAAQAADIIATLKEQQQFSTFAKAIESAGLAQELQGEGPYTVFAPTNQAFDQLPQDAADSLMQKENQDQLETLLHYHVIEGNEIRAKDALGKQTEVDTLAGDSLSVDGTGEMVLLVPAGLTVTRAGDQLIIERDVAAVATPTVEVAPTEGGQDQQAAMDQDQPQSGQEAPETQVTEESGMPASEHQEQVLATEPDAEQQQTMPQDSDMPSSPHQEQLLRGQQGDEQQGDEQQAATGQTDPQSGQQASETQVTEESGMPASEHQEQLLADQPGTEQQQTMPQDSDMPSSPHQEQVLSGQQGEQQRGQQDQGMLREANVIEPDILADNGVIHAIDRVLMPQAVLLKLESMPSQ